MRHVLVIVTGLTLSGCVMQMAAPPIKRPPEAPSRAVRKAATPTPVTTVSPSPESRPTPAPPPPLELRTLKGVVRIDPNYIIATGGGNLIGQAGGNIIAAGGGNLIGQAGGNLIGQAGGNYSLLQTASASPEAMLPVQGMSVEVVSLLTGERLAGPVETDAQGAYQFKVSEELTGNLLVQAHVPAAQDDPRLQYRLMVEPEATESQVLDEDTSLMTKMVVDCTASRLERQFIDPPEKSLEYFPEATRESSRPRVESLHREGQAANLADLDEAQRKVVLRRAAWVLLAHSRFHKAHNSLAGQPALESLAEVFEKLRYELQYKLDHDPAFAEPGQNPIGDQIRKATDIGDYLLEIFKTAETQEALFVEVERVFRILGVDERFSWKLFGAYMALISEVGRTIESNPEAMSDLQRVLRGEPSGDTAASDAVATP